MADASHQLDERGSKPPSSDKLPRAHKRCINKECREVMSLATKVREPRRVPRQRRCCLATRPPLPPATRRRSWLPAGCKMQPALVLLPAPAGAAVLQEVQRSAV